METLVEYASAELEIKKSRFLAEVFPVLSQAEARSLLKQQKEKYEDATHVVHGFVLGPAAEVLGMSDDGEPAGTAGRPVLDVLKGRSCTNILLTVTRWFGGTLLGTGGLVKAYGDSAKAVLNVASFHELVVRRSFSFAVDYDQYQLVKRYVQSPEFTNLTEDFGAQVILSGFVEAPAASNLALFVKDLTKGAVVVELGEEVYM